MNLKRASLLLLVTSIAYAQSPPPYWSKGISDTQIFVGRPFVIFVVGYSLGGYYAHCRLSNQTSHSARIVGATTESGDFPGRFLAKATLSVSTAQEGPWTKVTDVAPAGAKATLTVKPYSDSEVVIVELNKLAPLVDKFQYAKISLPTDEATIFSIKELKR